MSNKSISIKNTYYDALFFASADFNKKKSFYLSPAEFKVIIKLIHYGDTYEYITFQNKDIAKHTFLAERTTKNTCESLAKKGFINSQREIYNNRLGYATKRTITINWDLIQKIHDMINQPEAIKESHVKEQVKETIQPEVPVEPNQEAIKEEAIKEEAIKEEDIKAPIQPSEDIEELLNYATTTCLKYLTDGTEQERQETKTKLLIAFFEKYNNDKAIMSEQQINNKTFIFHLQTKNKKIAA